MGDMTPRMRAEKARIDATERYRWQATDYLIQGDRLAVIDHDGAHALWCDGMKALDAAEETLKGLEA